MRSWMKEEAQRSKLEWCQREREKLKDRIAITTDPVMLAYYRKELSAISKQVLAIEPKVRG